MKSHTLVFVAWSATLLVTVTSAPASGAPKPAPVSDEWLLKKGMQQEGPLGPAILWLDEATQARGAATGSRSASAGTAEALIFHQPNDSGFGYFEKSYTDGPWWYCRMGFGNGWAPGDSISSYELRIFHSSSDDINFGAADYAVELWDGDLLSLTETVCTTGGVSAPIPGTQGIIADVPYGTTVQARVELPAKVAYDCDRVWMVMTSLNGCRAAWRISGGDFDRFNMAPAIGFGNGRGLLTGCESATFGGVCPTTTGYAAGFCCGSQGTCSGSGAACGFTWDDCPAGQTCDGAEACDHSVLNGAGDDYLDPCSSEADGAVTFCGPGTVAFFFATVDRPDTEHGYVGSIFAATETYMRIVPVSVDEPPPSTGIGPGVISLVGDEVVLDGGEHNVWFEIMIGDWSPHTLNGYVANVDLLTGGRCSGSGDWCDQPDGSDCPVGESCDGFTGSFDSGDGANLEPYLGSEPCGECDDNAQPCFGHADCTPGTCSGSGDPCHNAFIDCQSGESCDGPASCEASAAGNDVCEASIGEGSICGPPWMYGGTATGSCAFALINQFDPRWALRDAGATIQALDLAGFQEARLGYAVIVGPPAAPDPFPGEGMYLATFAVHVPTDARGTYTMRLKPFPNSVLVSGVGPPIPLLGTVPGFITIQTGRCCITSPTGEAGCLDDNQTVWSCAQLDGVTVFAANETCPANGGPPCECDPNVPGTFDDGDACTVNDCIDSVPTATQKVCDDGLICTDNLCDSDDPTGVGCFYPPVDVDDGVVCTVDACTEATGITHRLVNVSDGDACTFDYCVEPSGDIFHDDLSSVPNAYACPTGDPVADGCPGATTIPPVSTTCTDGYCHCVQCFSGVSCSVPECSRPDAPKPELVPSGGGSLVVSAKNRFISFGEVFDVCAPLKAARVTFVSLPRPFDVWNGHQLWVTHPVEVNQTANTVLPAVGSQNIYAATLGCDEPAFASYGCMGTVHVFHEGIVPNGIYEIEFLSEFCSPDSEANYSQPVEIINSELGDVVGFVNSTPPSAPDEDPDVMDFLAILGRFSNASGAIVKTRADLEPGCIDLVINISDVLIAITGFQGLPYPFAPTASDPCASMCSNPLP